MLFILLQSDKGAEKMYRVFQKEFSNGCHWKIDLDKPIQKYTRGYLTRTKSNFHTSFDVIKYF